MSLSKCSPWFGGHSVVKILAQWFECDDTPNPGSKKPSWSQLSDGVSCLSWWFIIFMAKNGFVSRNGKNKFIFCCSEIALSNFRKQILPWFMMKLVNFNDFWNAGAINFTMILAKINLVFFFGSFGSFGSKLIF